MQSKIRANEEEILAFIFLGFILLMLIIVLLGIKNQSLVIKNQSLQFSYSLNYVFLTYLNRSIYFMKK